MNAYHELYRLFGFHLVQFHIEFLGSDSIYPIYFYFLVSRFHLSHRLFTFWVSGFHLSHRFTFWVSDFNYLILFTFWCPDSNYLIAITFWVSDSIYPSPYYFLGVRISFTHRFLLSGCQDSIYLITYYFLGVRIPFISSAYYIHGTHTPFTTCVYTSWLQFQRAY